MTTKTVDRPTVSRKIPAKALYFGGDLGVDQTAAADSATAPPVEGAPPPPVPITIRARTSGIAQQGYWGPCVHDMNGYIPPTSPIAINYNHDRSQLIGAIPTAPAVVDGELVAQGQLVPFEADDIAAEVIYKGAKGVPYQASIQLDIDTLVIEDIEANLTVDVNGQTFTGPLVVFRQWGIEAVSITPFGADGDTSLEFARGGEFTIRCFSAGEPTMADKKTDEGDDSKKSAPTEADFAAFCQKNFAMDVGTMSDEQKKLFKASFDASMMDDGGQGGDGTPPDGAPVDDNDGDETDDNKSDLSRSVAKRMLTDFGQFGAVSFAEGKTYEQTAAAFRSQQDERIKTLEAQNAELSKKRDFHRGHPTPAAFTPPPGTEKKPEMADFSGHSEARRKLTAAIRMPAKN
jgi:hypothetical protein